MNYRQPYKVGSYRKRDHETGRYARGGAVMKYGDQRKGESWKAYEARKNAEFQRYMHNKYAAGGAVQGRDPMHRVVDMYEKHISGISNIGRPRGYDDGGFVSELGGTGDDWNPGDQGIDFPPQQSAPIADAHMDQPWSGNAGPPEQGPSWGVPDTWKSTPQPAPRPDFVQDPFSNSNVHVPQAPAWSQPGSELGGTQEDWKNVAQPQPSGPLPQAVDPMTGEAQPLMPGQTVQRRSTPDILSAGATDPRMGVVPGQPQSVSRPPAPVGGNPVPANAFTGPPAPQSYPFTGPPLPKGAQPVQYRPPAPTGGQQGFGQGNPYSAQPQGGQQNLPPGVMQKGFAPVLGPLQPVADVITHMVKTAFNAPGSPGQDPNTRSPLDIAKSWVGADRHADREALSNFIGNIGGQRVNPETTAWCAAFVNGVLAHNGQQGSNSLSARSLLNIGTDSTNNPQPGDVVVFSRGGPNSGQGHTGFYTGTDRNGNIQFIAGNQGGGVNYGSMPPNRLLGIRRAGPADMESAKQNVSARLQNGPGEYGTPSSGSLYGGQGTQGAQAQAQAQASRPVSRQPAPTGGGGGGYNSDMTMDRYQNPNPPIDSNAMDHRRWNGPALIATGASIASNTGGLGTALAQGLGAGQKSMDEQRKQLSTEAGVNNKAQQLWQQAQEHIDQYQRMKPGQAAGLDMQQKRLDLSRQRMSREDAGPTQAQILSAVQGEKRRLMATPEGSQMEETALEQTARANIQRIIQGGTQQRQQQQQQPGGNIPMPAAPGPASTPAGTTKQFQGGTYKKVKDGSDADQGNWERQ